MEKIKKINLKKGTEVYFLTSEKFTTSTVQFVFPVGWRQDPENFLGLAHFFEHLVGKRTKNFPAKTELTKLLEKNGIVSNAYTSTDITCYHHSSSHSKLVFSLEKLLETIYFSIFSIEDLQMEKEVVETESRQYLDDDDSFLWHKMMSKFFPGTSLEKFLFGTSQTLGNITTEVFSDFYKKYLNPKNVKIFIGTNNLKSQKKIVNLLENFYKKNSNIFTNDKLDLISEKIVIGGDDKKVLQISRNDKSQANLRLGWRIPKLNNRELITFVVLKRILIAGFSARLIKKLRDEMGLIYSIGFHRDLYLSDMSYVMFNTSCKKESKQIVFDTIRSEIEKLRDDITQKEIDEVVPMLEYFTERQVSVESSVDALVDSVIYNQKYTTTKEFLKLVEKVKTVDIKKLIQKIFVKENEYMGILE
jgi:predicted Zn-dependent peptidase